MTQPNIYMALTPEQAIHIREALDYYQAKGKLRREQSRLWAECVHELLNAEKDANRLMDLEPVPQPDQKAPIPAPQAARNRGRKPGAVVETALESEAPEIEPQGQEMGTDDDIEIVDQDWAAAQRLGNFTVGDEVYLVEDAEQQGIIHEIDREIQMLGVRMEQGIGDLVWIHPTALELVAFRPEKQAAPHA